jgi:hypothetical protein
MLRSHSTKRNAPGIKYPQSEFYYPSMQNHNKRTDYTGSGCTTGWEKSSGTVPRGEAGAPGVDFRVDGSVTLFKDPIDTADGACTIQGGTNLAAETEVAQNV